MGPDDVYGLLVELEQAATSCLDGAYCSMVWAGCAPPHMCDNGISIAVYGNIMTSKTNCTVLHYLEAHIDVSLCAGNPDSFAESTIRAEDFYRNLSKIYGGLIEWYSGHSRGCKDVTPDGFRCFKEEGQCGIYQSAWRIKL